MKKLFNRDIEVRWVVKAGKEFTQSWPNRRLGRNYRDGLRAKGIEAHLWRQEWELFGIKFLRRETRVS